MILKILSNTGYLTITSFSGSVLYLAIDDMKKRYQKNGHFEKITLDADPYNKVNNFLNPGFFIGLLFGAYYAYSGKPLLENLKK